MNVNLDAAYWLGLAVSVVLPVLVGLVTTRVTHAGTKAVLHLLLASLNGFLVELSEAGPGFDIGTAAILSLVAFGTGTLSHFGLWKPIGAAHRAQDAFTRAA